MTVVASPFDPARVRTRTRLGTYLRDAPAAAVIIVALLVLVAIFAPWIAPHDPLKPLPGARINTDPAWQTGDWSAVLGTDFQGRDILSRVIHGTRISVVVGLVGTLVAGSIGLAVGVVAGYLGGIVDQILMRIVDAWLAIPALIFAVFLAMVFQDGLGIWSIVIILGAVFWTRYARVIRGEVLSLRERDFVRLAQVAGAGRWRVMRRHIVPNVLNTWMVLASLTVGVVIILEASLSFLGIGVPPPDPAWGSMIAEARIGLLAGNWVPVAAPAVPIAATVFAFNLLGDWLRIRLDPTQRNL
ncbi:MAG: ABC transporter permease [Acidimicrobiales bacterium]|nr:ABC transporter permease [Acidimicrobiales bacterium]